MLKERDNRDWATFLADVVSLVVIFVNVEPLQLPSLLRMLPV
jgi:hypothetical protein